MTAPTSPSVPSGAGRYAGARIGRVEDDRLLAGTGTFVDDVTRPGMLHACFVRSPFARARIEAIDIGEARALPGVHAVLVAADLNPGAREQWHTVDRPGRPRGAASAAGRGRGALRRATPSRSSSPRAATSPRTPPTWWSVDFDPLPAVVDYAAAEGSEISVHETVPGNVVGEMAGPPAGDVEAAFDSAPHVVTETIRQHAYAPVPMETRGFVVEWSGASGEMTIWASTQVPHEVRLFCSRLLGVPEQRIRVVMRDTGGGFGQKALVLREEMSLMLAARMIPAPIKWIEDRRENLMSAGQSRHEHATARMALDRDGSLLAATVDHVQDVGAYPTPWPVGTAAAVGMLFPGPVPDPARHLHVQGRALQHGRADGVPGSVAVRVGRPGGAARHRRPAAGNRPDRAAPPQPPAARRAAVLERDRVRVRPRLALGDLRAGDRDARLRRLPPRAGRSPSGRPAPRRGDLQLHRADRHPASASTAPRARRSASSPRARSTCTSPADPRATASRPPSCSW